MGRPKAWGRVLPFPLKAHRDYSLAGVYEMRRTGTEAAVTRREMGFTTA